MTAQVIRDLRELGALDWAQDSLMMDDTELQRLLEDTSAPEALAGDDYKEAWEPGVSTSDDETSLSATGGTTAMTPAAMDSLRDQEKRVQAARTEEEKAAARRDEGTYRISLVYASEEAKIVKDVLGAKPAEKLLQLCASEQIRQTATP